MGRQALESQLGRMSPTRDLLITHLKDHAQEHPNDFYGSLLDQMNDALPNLGATTPLQDGLCGSCMRSFIKTGTLPWLRARSGHD